MTYPEFLATLRATSRHWVCADQMLRWQIGALSCCPVIAVFMKAGPAIARPFSPGQFHNSDYQAAAVTMHLDLQLAMDIAAAADGFRPVDPVRGDRVLATRRDLFTACGLPEAA